MKVNQAVVTAAGYGTRFLPATKNIPKEMLPLLDVPIIHDVVKECIDAGITKIIIVTRYGNNAVEDYFDSHKELEDYLKDLGKLDRYERFNEVFDKADIAYVRQHKSMPYGNGTPFLAAKPYLNENEPFAALFGDDLVMSKTSAIGELVKKFESLSETDPDIRGVFGVEEVPEKEVSRYGVVKFKDVEKRIISDLIEKPKIEESPSRYAVFGRYVFSSEIFNYLNPRNTGKDGEIWLTDAIQALAQVKNIYAEEVSGKWMTTGDPLRYIETLFVYAMQRPDLKDDLLSFIEGYIHKEN